MTDRVVVIPSRPYQLLQRRGYVGFRRALRPNRLTAQEQRDAAENDSLKRGAYVTIHQQCSALQPFSPRRSERRRASFAPNSTHHLGSGPAPLLRHSAYRTADLISRSPGAFRADHDHVNGPRHQHAHRHLDDQVIGWLGDHSLHGDLDNLARSSCRLWQIGRSQKVTRRVMHVQRTRQ